MNLRFEGVRVPLPEFDLALDLEISSRVTGIAGPSGSGKTTLLELVAGLRSPAAGRLVLDGRELANGERRLAVPPRQRRIGYVTQDETLFPHLSVRGNVFYGALPGSTGSGGQGGRVIEVLELEPLLDRATEKLSGGERRRVALARALLSEPQLLLLDEPLTGLDQERKRRILSYLETILAEFAIPMLYVAHDPDEVLALCDAVVVLERGRVESQGSPAEVFPSR